MMSLTEVAIVAVVVAVCGALVVTLLLDIAYCVLTDD